MKASRKGAGFARASLEEESAILAVIHAEPLLGAKRILDLLQGTDRCRPDLTERSVYEVLRRHRLNTREKRLQFAQGGSDNRMARLAKALSSKAPAESGEPQGEEA
jgi:hypothetical protein